MSPSEFKALTLAEVEAFVAELNGEPVEGEDMSADEFAEFTKNLRGG